MSVIYAILKFLVATVEKKEIDEVNLNNTFHLTVYIYINE